jgi:hypothetical protein
VAISEIINVPDTVAASTSTSKIPITAEKSTLPRSSDEAIQPSPQSKHSENTPAKDIIEETDQDSEEVSKYNKKHTFKFLSHQLCSTYSEFLYTRTQILHSRQKEEKSASSH